MSAATTLPFPLLLPSWLPDETFFSLASRYHLLAGNRLASATSLALFGHRQRGSEHDFPSRLADFSARTDGVLGDARTIALTRTILPFYLPLRTAAQAVEATESMSSNGVGMIKFRLGILTSRFRANHPLKACPQCMVQDARDHGVAYWHLQHQWPGVWVCLRHHIELRHSLIKATGVSRFGWLLPEAKHLVIPNARLDGKQFDALARFAGLACELAQLTTGSTLAPMRLAGTYRAALPLRERLEPLRPRDIRNLAADFCRSVEPLRGIPELAALPSSADEGARTLDRWLRMPRGGTHPLRHLAIIFWLFPSWDAFIRQHEAVQVSTKNSDWSSVSLQRLGEPRRVDFLSHIRSGSSITRAARRCEIDPQTAMTWAASAGIAVVRRPKVLTRDALSTLIARLHAGTDKASIAAELSVSVQTVTRIMRTEVGLQEAWHHARFDTAQRRARELWLAALAAMSGGSKAVRAAAPATYAWLYRNDRDWLEASVVERPRQLPNSNAKRVDWDVRDADLSQSVRCIAAQLAEQKGRTKVALWEIYQLLPELKAKLGALDRLPLTRQAISNATRGRQESLATGLF